VLNTKGNGKHKFEGLQDILKGKNIVQQLYGEFELCANLKITFKRFPHISYENFTYDEMKMISMRSHQYPMGKI